MVHNHFQVVASHPDAGMASWKSPIVHCANHPRLDFVQQGAGPELYHHMNTIWHHLTAGKVQRTRTEERKKP